MPKTGEGETVRVGESISSTSWKWKSLSHVQLFENPWTGTHQAPLSMGFSRQEYWSGFPFLFQGDLPDLRTKPRSPAEQADSLPSELQKNPVQLNMCQVRYIRDQYLSLLPPLVSRSHPRDPLNSLLFILEFLFSLVNKGCFQHFLHHQGGVLFCCYWYSGFSELRGWWSWICFLST